LLIAGGILYAGRKKACEYAIALIKSSVCELQDFARNMLEALRTEEKNHLCALLIIVMTAVVVRLWFLFQPMRYDEAFTFIQFASKPLYRGLSDYSYPNNHPLHTLLVHIAYSIFGSQPWVIRLPVFCAGILTVAASYVATRIVFDKRSALLAAAFVASSPLLILYSTNARGYMLICLIFLTLYALGAALLQRSTTARWFLFTILSAAGFYTIPVMLYPFGIIVVWLCMSIIFPDKTIDRTAFLKNLLYSLAAVVLLTAIAYMPIMLVSGFESLVENRFIKPLPWTAYSRHILSYLYSIWIYWNKDLPTWISLPCAAAFIASGIFYRRLTDLNVPVVAAVPIWSIALLLVQRVMPHERVWIFLIPLYFVCASSGLSYFFKHVELRVGKYAHSAHLLKVGVPVMISLWLSYTAIHTQSVTHSTETGTLQDAEQITILMKDYLRPGDAVYAPCPSDSPLSYYFMLHGVPLKYFFPDPDFNHKRVVVIVNHHAHQTLGGLLDKANLKDRGFSSPKVIKQYDSATLYEMRRAEG